MAVTINVSGGGAALQTAIDGATPGDVVEITDSLDYAPILLNKAVTVQRTAGQNPRVISDILVRNGAALVVVDAGRNAIWDGVDCAQLVVGGGGGHSVVEIYNNSGNSTFTLRNADLYIDTNGPGMDGKVLGIGDNTIVQNCTISRDDNNPNPVVILFDDGGFSTFDGCTIGPSLDSSGITNIAAASQTLTIKNTTFTGIGGGGRGITASDRPQTYNLTNCTFAAGVFGIYAGNGSSSPGTVFNISRSKFGPKNNNWIIFAGDGSGIVFNITNTVFFAETRNNINFFGDKNHTLNLKHCTFTDIPGYAGTQTRRWVYMENNNTAASIVDVRNCLLNSPNSTTSLVNDFNNTLLVKPVVTSGVNLWNVRGVMANDRVVGVGTDRFGNPNLGADNIHLLAYFSNEAEGKGVNVGVTTDIDGESRPQPALTAPDLGADETSGLPIELSDFGVE